MSNKILEQIEHSKTEQPERKSIVKAPSATSIPRAAGNMAIQRAIHLGLAQASSGSLSSMNFPYAEEIRGNLGTSLRLNAVLDPLGCAARGTPAFTKDDMTHFINRSTDIHIAAHEAAHQVQHAGLTNDAGLGPEGHAMAIANTVTADKSARRLMTKSGSGVPSSQRNYQLTDKQGKWKDVEAGRLLYRLSETGETLTTSSQVAYATPDLITRAGSILKGMQSGISISPGGAGISVEPPTGGASKQLSIVKVDIAADPQEKKFYSDCREAAREVMGTREKETPEQAVVGFGEEKKVVQQDKPEDLVPMVIFLEQRIRETPNYSKLSDDEKRQVEKKAYEDFAKLTSEEKEKLKNSPVAEEVAKRLGIDKYVAPKIGEAFAAYRGTKAGMGQFHFHYATVIMTAGPDAITLENRDEEDRFSKSKKLTNKWKIETYGPASKEQSFHEEFARKGEGWHTLRIRTQLPPSEESAMYPQMPTYELFKKLGASSDPDEKLRLEQELKKRSAQINVQVDTTEDWLGDEVFVRIGSKGGATIDTSIVRFKEGTGHAFMVELSALWPIGDSLILSVFEFDVIGNDLIGVINWNTPYEPVFDVPLSFGDASYRVSLSMAGMSLAAPPLKTGENTPPSEPGESHRETFGHYF